MLLRPDNNIKCMHGPACSISEMYQVRTRLNLTRYKILNGYIRRITGLIKDFLLDHFTPHPSMIDRYPGKFFAMCKLF